MTDGVKNFLLRLGLETYFDMFIAKGFTLDDDISFINEEDLNSMYIFDQAHRSQLLQAAPQFKPCREFALYDWLRGKGLDHYFVGFVQSELTDLMEISRLNLPDEQLYDELEITLPGHKRRLERAVQQLCKKHKSVLPTVAEKPGVSNLLRPELTCDPLTSQLLSPRMEIPVTYGRWGKPACLMDAKYDFLLLDATIVSTVDSRDRVDIEFMVDSGSDVVTIRQEVLDTMDLELIGPIRSKGVHAARTKNLYKANLMIGSEVLEIEVMGESYDSIGSRVIRHFRHYISGNRHIWLKGDFLDPTMAVRVNKHSEETEIPNQISQGSLEQQSGAELVLDDQSKHTSDVDALEYSGENISEDSSTATAKKDLSKMQTDFVKVKTNQISVDVASGIVSCEKIEFQFSKINADDIKAEDLAERSETTDATDETDRLQFSQGDVIDVRPIIAANRKRHASGTAGFDPIGGQKKIKKAKSRLGGELALQTIGSYGNGMLDDIGENVDKNVKDGGESDDEVQTVVKQRSIYYRSEVRRKKQGS